MRSRAVVSCSVREHLRIGRSLGAFALMMTVVFSASTTSLASAEKQLGPRTPLQTAILAGDEQRARELVDQGAAVDEGLISAARTANGPLLELLIASGADAASFFGARALVVAMLVDSDDAVKVLRSNGAHLEAEDEAGRTVLVWASGQKRLGPLVRTAIAAGADHTAWRPRRDPGRRASR